MAPNRREQFKPLAPFISSSPSPSPSHQFFSSQENPQDTSERKTTRVKKFIRCCGCITALVLILVVILIVLGFTVYNVKEPEVKMNRVTLLSGAFDNVTAASNVTLLADVSVKNPNAFTFRYGNTTTTVYYDGTGIGKGTSPPGKTKARRTIRFNVTMEINATKVLDNPSWSTDIRDNKAVNISSYTRIDGKVKIFNLFKRKIVVELNCTNQYNITTGLVTYGDNCIGYVDI